ncbi:MAG: DEAD/DEAH box helicase family protein [Gammaproteobacteria bacterium]|nr:DEAD/DEAH box helicase family protein [Gammaproteobacteria bacterium]MCY4357562.1 DEAD/DEAH box helicase family protein [Gammaproteobacteria bacterium]
MLFEYQQYQQDCVNNIVNALEGVEFTNGDFSAMKDNLNALRQTDPVYRKFSLNNKKHLDVLMETGTGKTFTYLQTILELNRHYLLNKFIIVLPRISIKLGVIQFIKLTESYFFNEYQKRINFIDYPKQSLSQIQNEFIDGDELCVLITTNSAFNSENNNINKSSETLFNYGSTWSGIASCNPVIIVDEPHLLKGAETQRGLDKLVDSLIIRFGATYPDDSKSKISNVVYLLDSITAFNQYLVKRIGVSTIYADSNSDNISVNNLMPNEKSFQLCFSKFGLPQRSTISKGDDIGEKTGLEYFNRKFVTRISSTKVFLSDRTFLDSNVTYNLDHSEIRHMIVKAIQLHFGKEQELFEQGIKALTLFFIPKIMDYRSSNPIIKNIFEEEYFRLRNLNYNKTENQSYKNWLENDIDNSGELCVHEGYFSGDTGTKDEKEKYGIGLILNDKEKLLSFKTPLRFIFSVWALQEGWDNPNIFTICKLSATNKETTRRQQVGRGLRLAVNQDGKRITESYMRGDIEAFYRVNTVDMVVSGKEQMFIYQIQNEINDASYAYTGELLSLNILIDKGLNDLEASSLYAALLKQQVINTSGIIQSPIIDFLEGNRSLFGDISDKRYSDICSIFRLSHHPVVIDKNQKEVKVNVRNELWKGFNKYWEIINRKAKIIYNCNNEDLLIDRISRQFNEKNIEKILAYSKDEILNTHTGEIKNLRQDSIRRQIYRSFDPCQLAFQLIQQEKLPIKFVTKLLSLLKRQSFLNNQSKATNILISIIRDNIHHSLLQEIDYQFVENKIYPNSLQDEDGGLLVQIPYTKLGIFTSDQNPPSHYLYDKIVYDSDIEKKAVINDPHEINNHKITVFAKLPKLNIPTPYKNYNPDFAYLIKKPNGKVLFLVVETKGYDNEDKIPQDECRKIDYGMKFFKRLNEEIPELTVEYKKRINRQELHEILYSINANN